MNPTENVAMALFDHLGKTFEQDFDLYMDWSEIDEPRRSEWRTSQSEHTSAPYLATIRPLNLSRARCSRTLPSVRVGRTTGRRLRKTFAANTERRRASRFQRITGQLRASGRREEVNI